MERNAYILSLLSLDNARLAALGAENEARQDVQPAIGPEAGKLLGLLVRLTGARRVLEFGTCLGYSTIWLAQALRTTGGRLVAVEYDRRLWDETARNLAATGLADVVDLILGDSRVVAEALAGPFDLILQDAAKELYPAMLERCLALLRPGGLLIADDTLFPTMAVPPGFSAPIRAYNERVFADRRLYSTILPIGDGMTVSLKLADERDSTLSGP